MTTFFGVVHFIASAPVGPGARYPSYATVVWCLSVCLSHHRTAAEGALALYTSCSTYFYAVRIRAFNVGL